MNTMAIAQMVRDTYYLVTGTKNYTRNRYVIHVFALFCRERSVTSTAEGSHFSPPKGTVRSRSPHL